MYIYNIYRLTFINYCRRRRRMRSHKSNRALFVSLSATNGAGKYYVRFYVLSSGCMLLYDRYRVVCNFILDTSKNEIVDEVKCIVESLKLNTSG